MWPTDRPSGCTRRACSACRSRGPGIAPSDRPGTRRHGSPTATQSRPSDHCARRLVLSGKRPSSERALREPRRNAAAAAPRIPTARAQASPTRRPSKPRRVHRPAGAVRDGARRPRAGIANGNQALDSPPVTGAWSGTPEVPWGRRGRRPARQIAIEPLSAPMTAGRRPELERRRRARAPAGRQPVGSLRRAHRGGVARAGNGARA